VALGGYGVAYSNDRFSLVQGRARSDVDQAIGLVFFLLTYILLAAFVALVLLSLAVFARQGTVSAPEILATERRDRRLLYLIRAGWACCLLPVLAALLRLLL
jgi:hypothetical protein